jgi:D-2-hydroxyacid dehydrogenase (NADP+)
MARRLKIAIYQGEFLEAPSFIESYVARIVDTFGCDHDIMVARTREEFARAIADADVAVCWNMPPECFAEARRLRWISFGSAGIDHTAFPELLASDVILSNMSGIHPTAVAEHVFAVTLALARKLHTALYQQREARWHRESISPSVIELAGQTLSVIGAGKIGTQVARIGKAFGMTPEVLLRGGRAGSPAPSFDRAFAADERHDFVARADVLVLAVPLTKETERIIGAEEFGVMKPTSYLVNVARARCVDEQALIAALRDGRIAGAALDVFLQEPLPPDHPFWSMENVIVTPHTACATPYYAERAFEIFSENMRRFPAGEEMINVYDRARGY